MFAKDKNQREENALVELERKISELAIQNDALDGEIDSLLSEHNVSPSQLSTFLSNAAHFTPSNWETLQRERKLLDEKLKRELDQLISKKKQKKARDALRAIQPSWLFVR